MYRKPMPMCPQYGQLQLFVRAGYVQARLLKKSSSFLMILLIEEILHQLRLVVYPMTCRVLASSNLWLAEWDFWAINSIPKIHQLGGSWGSLQVAHVRVDHLFQLCKGSFWAQNAWESYALGPGGEKNHKRCCRYWYSIDQLLPAALLENHKYPKYQKQQLEE